MDMGYADYGGGPEAATGHHGDHDGHTASPTWWPTPTARPTWSSTLTARKGTVRLASGRAGRRLHRQRHLPRADDRAPRASWSRSACATRRRGRRHAALARRRRTERRGRRRRRHPGRGGGRRGPHYRFVADQVGTYWYHSHQVSHAQVHGGLFGALVVSPPEPTGPRRRRSAVDPHVRRHPDHQRRGGRRRRWTRRRADGPGPGRQHRQRRDAGLDRARRTGCSRWTGTTSTSRRRWTDVASP